MPPVASGPATTQAGDVSCLGPHRLICGDARDPAALNRLLAKDEVDLIFTDPPYNVAIDGPVGGLGKVKHREFAFASGEISPAEFTTFLRDALAPAAARCREGGHRLCLHGLAPHARNAYGGRHGVRRVEESLRLEQDQWRHGQFLSLEA